MYQTVASDGCVFGDYEPREEPYKFNMPDQKVPSIFLAKGIYKIKITYTADSHEELLSFEEVDFKID